jgi:hypothetical protein
VVVQAFFAALQPAQLNALDAILADQQAERGRLERHWQERRKRAEYEAHLARRQYDVVDPDNRLVAGELERRWEEKLRQVQQVEEEYERFQRTATPPSLTEEQRTLFREISTTLPTLWAQGRVTNIQKKELLRSLIERVIVKRSAPDTVEVKVVWISGHYSLLTAQPPIWREADVTGYEQMVARIEVLWREGLADAAIAQRLTAEGFRSARALEVPPLAVQKIRLARKWYLLRHQGRNAVEVNGYLTPRGMAARLGIERSWVYRRIYDGAIAPEYLVRHPQGNSYLIRDDPELLRHLQEVLQARAARRSRGVRGQPDGTPNVG